MKKKFESILENINEKRFIGRNENDSFTSNMSVTEFKEAIQKHNDEFSIGVDYIIEPEFPKKNAQHQYLASLRRLEASILNLEQKQIEEEVKKITDKFSDKLKWFEKQIRKLESIIFLEEEFGIKIPKKRKPKPSSSEESSHSDTSPNSPHSHLGHVP